MTHTHLSHFGLTDITNENCDGCHALTGNFADCKRMALAHGLELQKESDINYWLVDQSDERQGRILVNRIFDDNAPWHLIISNIVWNQYI